MTVQYPEGQFERGLASPIMARARRGKRAFLSGEAAEAQVAQDYARRGFLQAHRRWRGKQGEIDLIVRDGGGFVFVEVKKSRSFAQAAQSLNAAQMHRIYRTAEEFLAGAPCGQLTEVRFDVALVDDQGKIEIVENAFGLG